MLWRTLGALLLGAAVAVGVANLIIAVGRDEPRRPPGAVVLVPTPPDVLDATTVPSLPLAPPEPSAPDPTGPPPPTVVVPPPVHVDPAPAPPAPAPSTSSDDDDDDDDDDPDDDD